MLCAPLRGTCARVYTPGPERRVVDGRAIVSGTALDPVHREALLLVALAESARLFPSEIHRVDLDTGDGEVVFRVPEGALILDMDWIEAEAISRQ